jgi:glycosyltransferase involved in cell wall biosynthesis
VQQSYDVVFAFRLRLARLALAYAEMMAVRPRCYLDLDDVESTTSRRLAALLRRLGEEEGAVAEEARAENQAVAESAAFDAFDRVFVCSEKDRAELLESCRADVRVFPNAVVDPGVEPGGGGLERYCFLFVGTLSYFPNEEGLTFFVRRVLPRLRRATRRDVVLRIVGGNPTPALIQLAKEPNVELVGPVSNLAPWYREADAVVVPIRAGGGTRIKAIEAFSYRRPVVGTTIGLEGLDVRDGRDVLLADDAAALAHQCLRLMENPELGQQLAEQAYALFKRAYSPEAMARIVASLEAPPPPAVQ